MKWKKRNAELPTKNENSEATVWNLHSRIPKLNSKFENVDICF